MNNEYRRYYMQVEVYDPMLDTKPRQITSISSNVTATNELVARRKVLESAWQQGLFVNQIQILKNRNI